MTALARPTLRRLPLAAALSGFAALSAALVIGPRGTWIPSAVLAAAAVGLLLMEVVRRARQLLRSGLGPQIALTVLGSAVVAAAWSVVSAAHLEYFGFAFVLGLGGTALVMLSLLRLGDEAAAGLTPWQALTGGPTASASARSQFRRIAPLLAGFLAVLVALRAAVEGLTGMVGSRPAGALLLTLMMLAVFVVGAGWALRGLYERLAAARRRPSTTRDEQVVAAHLHDSVLQTLALIQRNAADPARTAQLARQQERSLRSWLAGRDETGASTLARALQLVAQAVEDEEPGARIEVLAVGDASLDPAADAMVQAAREAMRNAVRHAGTPVRVLLEVDDDRALHLFVCDTGPGFRLDAVADERRGVRDAIIGRMQHAGGTATIDSGPSGTEIALRLPPAGRAPS
jgi:signal transduction histidine kinase